MAHRASFPGFVAAFLSIAGTAPAVTVLDPDGRPVPGVGVVCVRGAVGMGLSDDQGRFVLPAGCSEAACMRGGFLTGRARIAGEDSTCHLAASVVVHGELHAPDGAEPYLAALVSSDTRRVAQSAPILPASRTEPLRFHLEAPPGAYLLEILRGTDSWCCVSDVGSLLVGQREVVVEWREPLVVRGVVLDPEGRPFGRVLLRVEYTDGSAGQTRCEMDLQALDVISEKDGRFRAFLDPARPYRIVADDAWQPATIRIDAGR